MRYLLLFLFLVLFISSNAQELKIVSWNIGVLPILEGFKNNNNRIVSISNALNNNDFDIISFEEAFTYKSRSTIESKLKQYKYQYGPINNKNHIFRFNGGIWILSKIPLKIIKEITFKKSFGIDFLSKKGAILLEGNINNSIFQIIVTHLQSSGSKEIKINQLTEIYNNLIKPYSNLQIPQIICGDFQNNFLEISNLLDLSSNKNEIIKGITFDDVNNDIYKSTNNPSMIDYILLRNSNNINYINRKVIIFKNKWKKGYYLSDHNAIYANINLKNTLFTKNETRENKN